MEDQIDILAAENALLRNAIQQEIKIGNKQVELYKLRQSEGELSPAERAHGSAIWRMVGRLKGALDNVGVSQP